MEICRERAFASIWGTAVGMVLVRYGWLPRSSKLPLGVSSSDLIFFLVAGMLAVATWFSLQEFRSFQALTLAGKLSATALPLAALAPLWSALPLVPEAGLMDGHDLTLLAIAALAAAPLAPQWVLCRVFRYPESRSDRWAYLGTALLVAVLGFLALPWAQGRAAGYRFVFLFSLILGGAVPWRKALPDGGWGKAFALALLQVELLWGMRAAHLPPTLAGGVLVVSFVLVAVAL